MLLGSYLIGCFVSAEVPPVSATGLDFACSAVYINVGISRAGLQNVLIRIAIMSAQR